jgi:hypothetical protein
MILDSVSGKKEDFSALAPKTPNNKNAITKILTATEYLIK